MTIAPLHLTKLAFGCADLDVLRARHEERSAGRESWIETRYRPTRHAELIGGSLYWIIRHRLVARQEILGFDETGDGRCRIRLVAAVIPVRGQPRKAHQGWRYLTGADAPGDLGGGEADLSALPERMMTDLAELALI